MSEQITGLYNFHCYIRTYYSNVQRLLLYQNKLEDCTSYGVVSEKISEL